MRFELYRITWNRAGRRGPDYVHHVPSLSLYTMYTLCSKSASESRLASIERSPPYKQYDIYAFTVSISCIGALTGFDIQA